MGDAASGRSGWKRCLLGLRARCLGILPVRAGPVTAPNVGDRVLFWSQRRLGDAVVEGPSVRAVRRLWPGAVLHVACPEGLAPLFRPLADAVWERPRGVSPGFAGRLRENRFTHGIDATGGRELWPPLAMRWARVRQTVGFDIEGRGGLFSASMVPPGPGVHAAAATRRLLTLLGADPEDEDIVPRVTLWSKARARGEALLKGAGVGDGGDFVAFHPGGTHATQRWPADRMGMAAAKVRRASGLPCVAVGAVGEGALVSTAVAAAGGTATPVLVRDLDELAGVLGGARVVVCNNSGPLHLAAALGVPTVSTMGPTLRERWWPLGEGHVVLQADEPCLGCNQGRCPLGSLACMTGITAEDVAEAVAGALRRA